MQVIGSADIVTKTALVEVKCVSELKDEHALQLILYWAGRGCDESVPLFLYNVLTDELVQVIVTGDDARAIVDIVTANCVAASKGPSESQILSLALEDE